MKELDAFLVAQSLVRQQEQESVAAFLEGEILGALKGKVWNSFSCYYYSDCNQEGEILAQSIQTLKGMSAAK